MDQLRNEREHVKRRLAAIDGELESEPPQLKALYEVVLTRREPVGLVYVWPVKECAGPWPSVGECLVNLLQPRPNLIVTAGDRHAR